MRFANQLLFWSMLLVIVPAMLVFFWWSWRERQRLMAQFIQTRLLASLTVGISPTRQKIRLACLVMATICLIATLARPQLGFDWEEVKQRGLDVIVAIDTSKSMLAEDIAPNRLKRAKLAALDLMQQAKSDRLALIAFAGGAFLQCPLTIDDAAFRQSVDTLDVNIIPQGGTAIAEAIDTAIASFREGDNHKALVLFTDGEDQDSGAVEAAKRAGEAGIHIYTIGIGSPEGELLRITDAKGRTDYIRDEQGNVVKSHLNESLLREIAGATPGGFYLPLRGAKTMETLYEKGIGTLPKSETSEKLVRRYHERYHWPLAIGMIFLLIEMLFPERKRERSKSALGAPAKAGLRAAVTVVVLLAAALSVWGSPASALREYKDGKYDNALKDYQKALDKKKDDPRLHFNAGAAAYKSKNFEEAAKQFDEALNSPDLKLLQQSYYNRGNARYYLGESNPDPSRKTETWEEAVKDFDSAMQLSKQLNTPDADAKFNYEFVKKKLEELKQQQQQQKNDKNDQNKDDQNKDQQQNQDKKDQDKKDQDKKDQQNKDQENKDQAQQNKDSQQQKDQQQKDQQQKEQAQKDKEKQKQSAEQKKKELEKQEAQQSSGKPGDKDTQEGQQSYAVGRMTPQQAQQLLDAEKGHEMVLPPKLEGKPRDPNKPLRDW
jgi:Ca-activated chloride channel family protein